MPYIPKGERIFYDKVIDALCELLQHPNDPVHRAGHLNYIITRICMSIFKKHTSYRTICMLTGVLENVKQELYRRQFADYEDAAIKKNGDL